jgi:hypothetical protein
MNCNTPTDICFSFEGFTARGGDTDVHKDGWGIAFFEEKGCRVFLDSKATIESRIADLVRTYPRLFSGTHTRHPAYEHHRVREVTIAAPGIVAYADGERLGPLPLTVRAVPGALRVLVGESPHMLGGSTGHEGRVGA